jgi:hypothetical protein
MRILAVIAIVLILPAAGAQELRPGQEYSVPDWARIIIADPDVAKRFVLDSRLNPFCLRGDFDGDGKADFAVLVKERSSGKAGVAVIHRATGRVFIMGAGTEFGNGGDNYSWMDAWIVFDKGRVPQGATREPPLQNGGGQCNPLVERHTLPVVSAGRLILVIGLACSALAAEHSALARGALH